MAKVTAPKDTPDVPNPVAPSNDFSALASAIAQGITAAAPKRKISSPADYQSSSPFNPQRRKRELMKDFSVNGGPLFERYLHDDEIAMLHQVTPGTYGLPGFPIVVREVKSATGGRTKVSIRYPEKDVNDRMTFKSYAPTFHQMLVKLVAEAKAQLVHKKAEARALLADE